jgi:uncharacterized RDD family membrane protein YckC
MVYDSLLILAMWMLTLFPLVMFTNAAATGATVQSLLFLELFAFFAYFWVFKGQTLGMLAWQLTLCSVGGPRFTLNQALMRFIAVIPSIICLGVGYLWIFIDPLNRSWPDLFSNSVVLHTPK